MIYHYFYNFLIIVVSAYSRKRVLYFIAATYPLFLLLLPSTGADFPLYESAYHFVYFDISAPLFFRTATQLTAEPGWFLYTGLFHLIISDFRIFLVVNFLICMFIFYKAFKGFGLSSEFVSLLIVLMVPVEFPTIMFWSPRSSISLAFCFMAISLAYRNRFYLGMAFGLAAILIHSQYIPITILSLSIIILIRYGKQYINKQLLVFGAVVLLGFAAIFPEETISLLAFLPSESIIESKVHYIGTSTEGFRYSAILSILLYPLYLRLSWKTEQRLRSFDIILIFVCFSCAVNIIFFYSSHVAGRLSRASDYFLFPYVSLMTLLRVPSPWHWLVLLAFTAIFPFAFPDLYSVNDMVGGASLF